MGITGADGQTWTDLDRLVFKSVQGVRLTAARHCWFVDRLGHTCGHIPGQKNFWLQVVPT